MEHSFWHARWAENQIGFHQRDFNGWMRRYWADLDPDSDQPVLVPLSGKSKDLLWLREQGHSVVGVELSEIACKDFFKEQGVNPEVKELHKFKRFAKDGIELFCGDLFEFSATSTGCFDLVYDRASLIAFPESMRTSYVEKISELMNPGGQVLLVTLEYDEMREAPPFKIFEADVRELYVPRFSVELLDSGRVENGRFQGERECVYRLRKL